MLPPILHAFKEVCTLFRQEYKAALGISIDRLCERGIDLCSSQEVQKKWLRWGQAETTSLGYATPSGPLILVGRAGFDSFVSALNKSCSHRIYIDRNKFPQ
jgi:hypothetical protein